MPLLLMDGVGVRVSSEPPQALPFVIPEPKEEKLQFSGHKEQGKKISPLAGLLEANGSITLDTYLNKTEPDPSLLHLQGYILWLKR